ncbi:MAG: hypothetical protein N4A32_01635 [Marinifilaceae bacterium]|jgi:hypothetical protein|nr:hypothetical protein [Marinifilaceae bacterium]
MNDNISEILKQKKTPKLNNSFEDDLMLLIHEKVENKHKYYKEGKRIYMFVFLSLVIGILIAFYLQGMVILFDEYSFTISKNFLFIPILIGLLFAFEKAYSLYLLKKRQMA